MRSENQSADQDSRSFIEQARRAQIVRAAIETIAEVGFAKASVKEIATRANISTGLISYHFAGKDELIQQVIADVNADLDRAIGERANHAASYTAALRALLSGFVYYCAEHRTEMYALRELEANGVSTERGDSVAELAEMLREGQEHGEFREFSPRLMAVTLYAALSAIPGELYSRADTNVEQYAEELAETFALAVRRTGRGRRRHG